MRKSQQPIQPAQAKRLAELGCQFAQGHFFGRPMMHPNIEGRSAYSRFSAVAPILN